MAPHTASSLAPATGGGTAAPRPFGTGVQDLDLDLGSADRPALVTALLAQCVPPADEAHWWAQPVGVRTAALLRLVGASDGVAALALSSRCGACGEAFGFELPLQSLAVTAACDPMPVSLPDGREVVLRRPTGNDLRAWRDAPAEGRVLHMLASLCVRGEPGAADVPLLAAAASAQDPLVACAVDALCPACGAAQEVPVDLESLALHRLAARQQALLEQVHVLAARYGWSERQVLAVPPRRRLRYLALIGAEAGP